MKNSNDDGSLRRDKLKELVDAVQKLKDRLSERGEFEKFKLAPYSYLITDNFPGVNSWSKEFINDFNEHFSAFDMPSGQSGTVNEGFWCGFCYVSICVLIAGFLIVGAVLSGGMLLELANLIVEATSLTFAIVESAIQSVGMVVGVTFAFFQIGKLADEICC